MDGNSPDISELRGQIDVRKISKINDPEGRDQTAGLVRDARAGVRLNKAATIQHEQELKQIGENRRRIAEAKRETTEKLDDRFENKLVKLKLAIGFGDKAAAIMQSQIGKLEQEDTDLLTRSFEARRELEKAVEDRNKLPNPKDILNAYYEKIAVTPLTNQEKRELLLPEAVAQLTEGEYIALWRRLNPHFLTHVTRQGFRDHHAMVYHTGGLGEFQEGFVRVINDGKEIRPPIVIKGLRIRDESVVEKYIEEGGILKAANESEAKERLHSLLNFHLADAPKYPDETAMHLSGQKVSNAFYGGEKSNEVFFLFPSDVIASQYNFAFNWKGGNFVEPTDQGESKWNDVFIWPHSLNNPGISVDSGIVFLPDTTRVDPNTGSKYASEMKVVDGVEKRVRIEDPVLVGLFIDWSKKIDDQSKLRQVFMAYKGEKNYYRQQDLREDCFVAFVYELQKLGFATDTSATLAGNLIKEMILNESLSDEVLLEIVKESGANWKRAENVVPAKEYWEGFFCKNPNLRPKHVQYYDGDPTAAVYKFQQQNDIGRADTSKTEGQLLGFDDHHVLDMKKDPRANVGYDELVAIAEKIIEDHYKQVV